MLKKLINIDSKKIRKLTLSDNLLDEDLQSSHHQLNPIGVYQA